MINNGHLTYGFIGLGLIGGSIAKGLKNTYPDCCIIAYDIKKEAVLKAISDGVVNVATDAIDESFSKCDYIFLCAPVSHNDDNLNKIKEFLSPDCILTDVGSVKSDIHAHIEALSLSHCFIGGHPMAGSERTGYINSKALLLENAYYILTPTDTVPREKLEHYHNLVTSLGAIPLIIDHKKHDFITAAISHLPHVIAASLVNLIKQSDSEDGLMKMIAAGGFKDITRIASSSPAMWQQICMTNTENISELLDSYISSLLDIKKEIVQHKETAIYDFFDSARSYRDSFIDASSGPIKKSHSINIEIADEPGALASIATILALNNISIKNIGIVHNREQEDGVLRIEFYAPESIDKACSILSTKGYIIHHKK